MYLSNFKYLHPFWRYLPTKFEVIPNWAKFCMFLASKILGGRFPKILDQHYKIYPTVVSHLAVVMGLCTDDPKDFYNLEVRS